MCDSTAGVSEKILDRHRDSFDWLLAVTKTWQRGNESGT